MRFTTKVLPSRTGNLGIFTLNHPKALHALSLDMIHCFQDVLGEWQKDETMKGLLIKSSGDAKRPAFCAGGDVKAVYDKGLADENAQDFFYQEYQVNHAIATSPIPQVALWDGVVMGGGVGLSIHGKYRVATENTLFAMPETAIGLFPDVGSMYWMPRLLQKNVANYLALTGKRLVPADLLYTKLATHFVPSKELNNLEAALVEATSNTEGNEGKSDIFSSVLMSFHESIDTQGSFLAENQAFIAKAFNADTVEQIMSNLESDQSTSKFVKETLETLQQRSPTSMKVTLEGLKRGLMANSIGECLQMEYRMANACVRNKQSDFYEGVRAVLVDKDHKPKWNPPTLEGVTDDIVAEYFAPLGNECDEWVIPEIPKQMKTSSKL